MATLKIGKTTYFIENVKKYTKSQFIKRFPNTETAHIDKLSEYFIQEIKKVEKPINNKKKASE